MAEVGAMAPGEEEIAAGTTLVAEGITTVGSVDLTVVIMDEMTAGEVVAGEVATITSGTGTEAEEWAVRTGITSDIRTRTTGRHSRNRRSTHPRAF